MSSPTRIGRYEIIRRLGKSMTDVYLALDTVENRQAALKLIKAGPDTSTRMILEAERRGAVIQKQLRELDPRVVEVYDYGDAEGYFFVAMQYLEGRNLAEVLKGNKRVDAYRAARIAIDICTQLEKFHSFRGEADGPAGAVVHGDIKPSNIHLGPNDTVRLLDFGIAKTLAPNRDYTVHDFGSPSYCSPERLEYSHVDAQADLWAVGVTLYEMVAGMPPYQAESTQKLEKLIQSGLPPRALPESCPQALRAIVAKALAPHPAQRYDSAAEFHVDLRAFLENRETIAEQEESDLWNVNPTVEAVQPPAPEAAPRFLWWKQIVNAFAMAGCFFLGMGVLIGTVTLSHYWRAANRITSHLDYARRDMAGIQADWDEYRALAHRFGYLGRFSPVNRLRAPLAAAYGQGAHAIIVAYRSSADPQLRSFDWARAQTFLERAATLGATGGDIYGELALCRGYGAILGAADWKGSDRRELTDLRQTAWTRFSRRPNICDVGLILTSVWHGSACTPSLTWSAPWPSSAPPKAWVTISSRARSRKKGMPTASAPSRNGVMATIPRPCGMR